MTIGASMDECIE